jgi:hypothetical protein
VAYVHLTCQQYFLCLQESHIGEDHGDIFKEADSKPIEMEDTADTHEQFPTKQPKNKRKRLSLRARQTEVGKRVEHLEKQVSGLQSDNSFLKLIQIANSEEADAHSRDVKTANVLRVGGYQFDKKSPYIQQADRVLKEIAPHLNVTVTKIKKNKKKDIFDIWLSDAGDASVIFSMANKDLKELTFVHRVTSPETAIRFAILEAISLRLKKRYKTNPPRVDFVDMRPHLLLFKGGAEGRYTFTGALGKFRSLFESLDLTHAKDLANTHALKGNNLRQFVLL